MTRSTLAGLGVWLALGCSTMPTPTPTPTVALERRWETSVDFAELRARYGRRSDYAALCSRGRPLREALDEIAERDWPTALALSKRAIWQSLDRGLDEALSKTWDIIREHTDHPDLNEGTVAFVEKRKPRWAPFTG